jgi:aminopeptidase N
MRILFSLLAFLLIISSSGKAQRQCSHSLKHLKSDPRASQYEVLHYDLFHDMIEKGNDRINAEAAIQMHIIQSTNDIKLDIKSYDIDTVWIPGKTINYSYNDSSLNISAASGFNSGDNIEIHIHYSGTTHREAANFGGFFFRPPYAYNIAVAFVEVPHNFGRVWYPCLDFFTSRSTYTTRTLTYGGDISVASGILTVDSVVQGDTMYRVWEMSDPIPSYLHSLSVAPYEMIEWQHQGQSSSFPVELYSLAGDTAKLRNSFINLDSAIRYYEESYYDYVWQKVGYSILPMNGGAMEHSTNIAYPRFAIGPGDYETLMAHELSHHWWGNLVTCDEASEMWLNEGWASFSEYLFLEKRYGWERAKEDVMDVLYDVLLNADHDEGTYRAVSGIPEPYIYGTHVYDKGSLVALALREYLGNDFESSIRSFFDQNKFKSINSGYLQSELERISGRSLSDFFDSWVYEPGFVDFSLGENTSLSANEAVLDLKQSTIGTNKAYKNVPLNIRFIYDDESTQDVKLQSSGGQVNIATSQKPKHVLINPDTRLPLAFTADELTIKSNGAVSLDWTELPLEALGLTDSAWVRLEQHFSAPYISAQNAAALKVRISKDRHWRLYTSGDAGLRFKSTFAYDGRSTGRKDDDLNGVSEDSLVILYKELYGGQWRIWEHYSQNQAANANDAFGTFSLTDMIDGYFAIGIMDPTASITEKVDDEFSLFPNPVNGELNVQLEEWSNYRLVIYDIDGRQVYFKNFKGIGTKIDVSDWAGGQYFLEVTGAEKSSTQKFIVQ